jgi:uncharacterized protein
MSQRLPSFIDPFNFVERQCQIAGILDISAMDRLGDILTQYSGQVAIDLVFYKDKGQAAVKGHVETELMLNCQNCLETMIWSIDKQFKLGIVASADAVDRLSDEYEPLLVEGETISLVEMIEDELLLNIPAFPKHQQACVRRETTKIKPEKRHSGRETPFSVLAKLKNTGDK